MSKIACEQPGYHQTRDTTGVAATEFIDFLATIEFERSVLAKQMGMDEGQLSVLLSGKQKWISLKLADRILHALGYNIGQCDLVIIPGHLHSDAMDMAHYEYLDADNEPTADLDTIKERADELWAMRETMLSGDPEARAFVKASFVFNNN